MFIVKMADHFDGNHRYLVENNVPIALKVDGGMVLRG